MNLILIGLATGVLTGLTGASGMSVLISALLLMGMDVRDVVGLTFAVTLVNALGAMGPYIRRKQWDKRLVLAVGLPAVAGVFVGNAAGRSVPSAGLTAVMSVALLAAGLRFLLQKKKAEGSAPSPAVRGGLPALIAMGMVIGVVMGVMGGGGSIFITLALVLAFRFPLRVALGSSIMIMAIAAVPGILLNMQQAHLDLSHAAQLVIPGGVEASFVVRECAPIIRLRSHCSRDFARDERITHGIPEDKCCRFGLPPGLASRRADHRFYDVVCWMLKDCGVNSDRGLSHVAAVYYIGSSRGKRGRGMGWLGSRMATIR